MLDESNAYCDKCGNELGYCHICDTWVCDYCYEPCICEEED